MERSLKVRGEIDALVCSGRWREVCEEVLASKGGVARPAATLDHDKFYPPGGSEMTLMRRCRSCCRWSPPYSFVGRRCQDCVAAEGQALTDENTHRSSTSSPTAVALALLERWRVRLVEPRLPAADEASLRRLIARFYAIDNHKKSQMS